MDRVRGAWVEFYKQMVLEVAAERVYWEVISATNTRAAFAAIFLRHVQDEADFRMRSEKEPQIFDGRCVDGIVHRGQSSKVQQHVVEICTKHGALEIPTEMEALSDKTAAIMYPTKARKDDDVVCEEE